MEARERMIPTDLRCNLEETLLQKTRVDDLTVWACVYLCVYTDTSDEKQLESEEKSEQILMDCKSVWRRREFFGLWEELKETHVLQKHLTVWSRKYR